MKCYDDIIDLPHYRSATREPMPVEARAAQFSSFAALSGHEDAIEETARFTDTIQEMAEHESADLSLRLRTVMSMSPRPVVRITYFRPDRMKKGGAYHRVSGRIVKADQAERLLVLDSGMKIPLGYVKAIDGDFDMI